MIRNAVNIVRHNWRVYATVNLVYYGLVVAGMFFVASHPEIQKRSLETIRHEFHSGSLASVDSAYRTGSVLKAILLTFVVNLFVGSFATITVPSLIVPFSGLLMGIFRAVVWGLLLSPTEPKLRGAMIPHSLTLILEGQAYILAVFAAYILGKALIRPSSVGAKTHVRRICDWAQADQFDLCSCELVSCCVGCVRGSRSDLPNSVISVNCQEHGGTALCPRRATEAWWRG